MRDTHASWLLSLGVPVARVSKLLGHQSIQITCDHYAKVIDSMGDEEGYIGPYVREPGEVVTDFLARLLSTPKSVVRTLVPTLSPAGVWGRRTPEQFRAIPRGCERRGRRGLVGRTGLESDQGRITLL